MAKHPVAQLRLEPGAFRRHDFAASATAIKSSMPVGNIENAQAYSPLSTSFSSSAVPRMPPTKWMRSLVRGFSIPKTGASTCFWSSSTSSFPSGSSVSAIARLKAQRVPFAPEIKAEFVPAGGRGRAIRGDSENAPREFPAIVPASSHSNPSARGCRAESASGRAEKSRRENIRCRPRPCDFETPAPPPRCGDGRRRCKAVESRRTSAR